MSAFALVNGHLIRIALGDKLTAVLKERRMFRFFFVASMVAMGPISMCQGDYGLDATDRTIRDIDSYVDGAAAVVLFYRSPKPDEEKGFKEILSMINKVCEPPVHRNDKKVDMPAAIVVLLVEDERDVLVYRKIDIELENVSIVCPENPKAFLTKRKLSVESKSHPIFTFSSNGKIRFSYESYHTVPIPINNGEYSARMKQWNAAFQNLTDETP